LLGSVNSQWFSAGFFWDKDLLVCHYGWDSYSTVEDILAMAEEKMAAEGGAEA